MEQYTSKLHMPRLYVLVSSPELPRKKEKELLSDNTDNRLRAQLVWDRLQLVEALTMVRAAGFVHRLLNANEYVPYDEMQRVQIGSHRSSGLSCKQTRRGQWLPATPRTLPPKRRHSTGKFNIYF
ncbi:unnamed protein product [Arctia plantaginis]|uniref:Uncharacterized protein n=1 Tax=Arctia plantaginis TaxID=874455 RepID=A0A8S0YZR7_ARCPL|nr:unnamed protein product [Arctia plantaginis]